jgi:hypothetical protein
MWHKQGWLLNSQKSFIVGLFWCIRVYCVKIISVRVTACADYDFSALGLVVLAIAEIGCVCLYFIEK